MRNTARDYKIYIAFALSYIYSLCVLNRWTYTGLGLKSFGLLWQYYVSWTDFGFFRRGFLGTLLTLSGLNRVAANEYVFSYLLYGSALTLCYYLVMRAILQIEISRHRDIAAVCVLFSPAMFSHFAYATGNQDLSVFLIFLLGVFVVQSAIALSVALVAGVLTHELFIFLVPVIFVLKFVTSRGEPSRLDSRFVIPGLAVLGAIALVALFGRTGVPRTEFESVVASRIPIAAHQHPLWSGYFEVSSSIESNASVGLSAVNAISGYPLILIALPTIYAAYVAFIASAFASVGRRAALLLLLGILFPFAAALVATDYYRWASMSACLGLVAIVLLMSKGRLSPPRWCLVSLMCFSILAPFGAAELERPFPMHQFLWEAMARS